MREWPVPKRWTRPSAAIASAHHWLACSMAAACVEATRSSRLRAAVIQGSAGGSSTVTIGSVPTGDRVGRRGGDRLAGGAGAEVVQDRLRGRGPDPGDAEVHDRQKCIEG